MMSNEKESPCYRCGKLADVNKGYWHDGYFYCSEYCYDGYKHSIKKELIKLLSKLKCINHACNFNPPKHGLWGTNGSCSCLGDLPVDLRVALTKFWVKEVKNG